MNAEAILSKIGEDARETAERIESEAQVRVAEWKAASRDRIEGMHATMVAQARKDGDELEQRLLRMAEMEDRKALLQKKRELIDAAFALAGEKLAATTATEKRAFFLRQILRFAMGDETLFIGAEHADWYDEQFIVEANKALVADGKHGGLTPSAERRPSCVGLILVSNGAEIPCTFGAFIEEARAEMEQQVAADLLNGQ